MFYRNKMIKFENKIFVIKSNKLHEIPEICDRKKLLEEAHFKNWTWLLV